MTQNGKPKVEIGLNQEAKLTLLRDKCYEGKNNFGAYYLYSVQQDGEEKAFFATPDVHQAILEAGLKTGDTFLVRKRAVQNGRRVMAEIGFEIVEKIPSGVREMNKNTGQVADDLLKDVLLQCVKDADYVIRNAEGQISEEVQKLATSLFIARTRN